MTDPAATQPPADSEPVGPVRIRSANCAAGDHDECASMVEQDVVELGITDCLCACHADGPPADSEGSADAEHMREVSKYLSRLADKYPDRWHPDISYLRAGANYVGVLAGRAASPVAESEVRVVLERLLDAMDEDAKRDKYLRSIPWTDTKEYLDARAALAAADREEPTDDPA